MSDQELTEYITYKLGFVFFDTSTKEEQERMLKERGSKLSPEHLQELNQRMTQ